MFSLVCKALRQANVKKVFKNILFTLLLLKGSYEIFKQSIFTMWWHIVWYDSKKVILKSFYII